MRKFTTKTNLQTTDNCRCQMIYQDTIHHIIRCVFCAVTLLLAVTAPSVFLASDTKSFEQPSVYENDETGYEVYILDSADLLDEEEEEDLIDEMEDITDYAHAAFVSVDNNPRNNAERLADYYSDELFGSENGVVFLIDMDTRYLWIRANGSIRRTITDSYSTTITDNVYTYASARDYYTCSSKAFDQVYSLLRGKWIAQPMKWICNALLAVTIALLANYFFVMMSSRSKKATSSQLMKGLHSNVKVSNARAEFTNQTKTYSPRSSSSSGSRSGGRSGGGGGSRGGGGGHRF